MRRGTDSHVVKRDAFSLQTPDGTVPPRPTRQAHQAVDLRGIQTMATATRDVISYLPGDVVRRCTLGFFSDPDRRNLSCDQVELNFQTACLGRLAFHVPGGIRTGQHWLRVKFAGSEVQVPFRILTKEKGRSSGKPGGT